MNWTLRRAKKDGRIVFALPIKDGDEFEYYVPSTGDRGKTLVDKMRQTTVHIMSLCEADCKMVKESVDESS